MTLKQELYSAKYKGAKFLVNRVSTSGGRKTITHEYPNSDIQTVEDLGLKPREYRIAAIIAEPDYIDKRDDLLEALEEGGKGVLIHPFYGRMSNIVAKSFSLNEDVSRLGDTVVDIVFAPSETEGLPDKFFNVVSQISHSVGIVVDNVVSDIANFFKVF